MTHIFSSKVVRFSIATALVLGAVVISVPSVSFAADALTRELSVGMSGADVSTLQTFLAQDATLYPQGIVSGYFGFLTKAAVSNFQSRNGISPVGRVGPATLPVLNAQIASGMYVNKSTVAPVIYPVSVNAGRTSATVNWSTNEAAKGIVYFSQNPLALTEHPTYVDVGGRTAMTDSSLRTSHSVTLAELNPNTSYYYLVYTTDLDGNVSVTWPAIFTTGN